MTTNYTAHQSPSQPTTQPRQTHTYEVRYQSAAGATIIVRCWSHAAALREWRWQLLSGRVVTMESINL